jgi:hypothetical protein
VRALGFGFGPWGFAAVLQGHRAVRRSSRWCLIKWLGRVVVAAEETWTRNNTTNYVLIGEDGASTDR